MSARRWREERRRREEMPQAASVDILLTECSLYVLIISGARKLELSGWAGFQFRAFFA
jgi:hypothetical protein